MGTGKNYQTGTKDETDQVGKEEVPEAERNDNKSEESISTEEPLRRSNRAIKPVIKLIL